ncbi:tRNA methyltransferase 2 [Perkinsus olseni]|uniref:tRNA methyltransferase 2 n=1 Tax=Perkinsus olseni TaxID=32597 RepID=A0A7J6RBF7_PEROL|nr:tRNA methyltransferase 2 [Perkinsus olseni]
MGNLVSYEGGCYERLGKALEGKAAEENKVVGEKLWQLIDTSVNVAFAVNLENWKMRVKVTAVDGGDVTPPFDPTVVQSDSLCKDDDEARILEAREKDIQSRKVDINQLTALADSAVKSGGTPRLKSGRDSVSTGSRGNAAEVPVKVADEKPSKEQPYGDAELSSENESFEGAGSSVREETSDRLDSPSKREAHERVNIPAEASAEQAKSTPEKESPGEVNYPEEASEQMRSPPVSGASEGRPEKASCGPVDSASREESSERVNSLPEKVPVEGPAGKESETEQPDKLVEEELLEQVDNSAVEESKPEQLERSPVDNSSEQVEIPPVKESFEQGESTAENESPEELESPPKKGSPEQVESPPEKESSELVDSPPREAQGEHLSQEKSPEQVGNGDKKRRNC